MIAQELASRKRAILQAVLDIVSKAPYKGNTSKAAQGKTDEAH
jgi:hypothetical protein